MPLDVNAILESGDYGEMFHEPIKHRLAFLPANMRDKYLHDARVMTAVGVSDAEDQKIFFHILQHTPSILEELNGGPVDKESLAKVAATVFQNRKERPINSVLDFFKAIAIAADEAGVPLNGSIKKKVAYPQGVSAREPKSPYDIHKWMQATQDIYLGISQGKTFEQSRKDVTQGWSPMEKNDYKYWLRFFQEKTPEKYKTAQKYYESDIPGFYIPNIQSDHLKAGLPTPVVRPEGMPILEPKTNPAEDKRDKIESQRSKIISRLNAAEKLLASMDGQFFAGDDQELMLKLLQDLKRKVQTANKIHVHSSLFIDLIYKTSNLLRLNGKETGAAFFYKMAQMGGLDLGLGGPNTSFGGPSGGDASGGASSPEGNKEETKKALNEFFSLLETGVGDVEGDQGRKERAKKRKEKRRENRKQAGSDVIEVIAQALNEEVPIGSAEEDINPKPIRPRIAPEVAPVAPPAAPPAEIEVQDEDIPADTKAGDDAFEAALGNITVEDVVARLEMIASIYKRREMSRQLAEVDIMMDRLGISAYFPSLGEAMGKALESNQYISTRVDDVLAKLKGTVSDEAKIEKLTGVEKELPEETAGIRKSLKEQQDTEKELKEKRRQRQLEKETQEPVEKQVAEELGGEAPVERTQPVPTREAPPAPQPMR